MATAAQLRELADTVEEVEAAEQELLAAKEAYRNDKDNAEAKDALHTAKNNIALLRDKIRRSGVNMADTSPGSVTVGNASARQSAKTAPLEG